MTLQPPNTSRAPLPTVAVPLTRSAAPEEVDFAGWLALREPADAAARAVELLEPVRRRLAGTARVVVHDLGSGTGSMARWLAPRLSGPQHWVLHDRDGDLLDRAVADMVTTGPDGAPVTVEARRRDVTRLTAEDLSRASLVTASALLDMFTAAELDRVVAACAGADCPVLFTLTVVGRVALAPADPLDAVIGAAFDAHQRRTVQGRTQLGPDAVEAAVAAFGRHGVPVTVRSSPWRLGAGRWPLVAAWLSGWLAAACEQDPDLAGPAAEYARRRAAELSRGRLEVVVEHRDLLAG